jgi:hypothetical protein
MSVGFTIQGLSPAATVITAGVPGTNRVFALNHADAVLSSVTVSNGWAPDDGGGILLNNGLVTNCTIVRCKGRYSSNVGGGVAMSGGLLVDSQISGCYAGGGGGGLSITGGEALRCAIRENGAVGGTTPKSAVKISGGALRQSVVSGNTNNQASLLPAGIHLSGAGLVENCLVVSNRATAASGSIGGVCMTGGRLIHTTVADNFCTAGAAAGGIYATGGAATNCIAWGNLKGSGGSDFVGGDAYARFCAASELAVANGNKNANPIFVVTNGRPYQLGPGSPCIDAGTTLLGIALDLAGTSRVLDGDGDSVAVADMGAYEAPTATGEVLNANIEALSATTGFSPLSVTLRAVVTGSNTNVAWYGWDLNGDGTLDLAGAGLGQIATNYTLGRYTVRLWVTNTSGLGASAVSSNLVKVLAPDIHVSHGGSGTYPYETRAKATTNLQEALLMALGTCVVNIDTGIYWLTETCDIRTNIAVRGLAGPSNTTISASGSFRLFQLAHSAALLASLTVSNGVGPDGGGIVLTGGTVSNCIVARCRGLYSTSVGGGVAMTGGLLVDSTIRDCYASGGGGGLNMSGGEALRCTICNGGNYGQSPSAVGITGGALRQSVVAANANSASSPAGLTAGLSLSGSGLVENCLVVDNRATGVASNSVGGVKMAGGRLLNCTVVNNRCPAAGAAGGAYFSGGAATNTIVAHNLKGAMTNDLAGLLSNAWFSCASELTAGVQRNIAADPAFKDAASGDFRLANGSPCINAGADLNSAEDATDLAGKPRLRGGAVDMGAYEHQGEGGMTIRIK